MVFCWSGRWREGWRDDGVGVGNGGKAGRMTGGGGRVLSRSLEVNLVALVRETGSPGH